MYAGASDAAANRKLLMGSMRDTVCATTAVSGTAEFCYERAKSALSTLLNIGDLTAEKLESGLCSTADRCARKALESFSEIMLLSDSSAQGQLVANMFETLGKYMCLKDNAGAYCMTKFKEYPEGPEEGACAGKSGV